MIEEDEFAQFGGRRINNPIQSSESDDWLPLIGKSLAKGVAGIGDLARSAVTAFQDPNMIDSDLIYNETDKTPTLPFFSKEGLDYLDMQPKFGTNSAKRIASNAAEWAVPGGLIGKFGKGANLLGNIAKEAAVGATIGGTSGALQEAGINPLIADMSTIAGSAINPVSALKTIKSLPGKTATKLMGLSPKQLKLNEALAARDLGIDLPVSVFTDGQIAAHLDQLVSRTPVAGDILKNKYKNAESQVRDNMENFYSYTGPARDSAIEKEINRLYSKRAPENAEVIASNTLNAINDIEKRMKSFSPSDMEKQLLSEIKNIKDNIAPMNISNIKSPVDALVSTKKSLNATIKWNKDEGVKNQLRSVQKALNEDIKEYGQTNPEWYKNFTEADKLYGKVAKRKRLEELLGGSINKANDQLSYNSLSKIINTKSTAKELKNLTDAETFNKIKKLGEVAKALTAKSKNIPNPSGTAPTAAIYGLIGGLFTMPTKTVTGVLGGTTLLTNKKFLDAAIQAAEKPSIKSNMNLDSILKDTTGYSAIALSRELNNE